MDNWVAIPNVSDDSIIYAPITDIERITQNRDSWQVKFKSGPAVFTDEATAKGLLKTLNPKLHTELVPVEVSISKFKGRS